MKQTQGERTAPRRDQGLEWLLRIAVLLALIAFLIAFGRTFREGAPENSLPSQLGSVAGALVCIGIFVPWGKLPFLKGRVFTPDGYLGIVSRLLTAITLGSLPYLVASGEIRLALGALVVATLCIGLFLRWAPIVWGWYGFVAAGLVLALGDIWESLHAESTSFTDGIRFLIRVPVFLLWGAVLNELIAWQRERSREAPASPVPAPPAPAEEPPAAESPAGDTPAD